MGPPSAIDVIGISDTQSASFSDRLSVNGVPARRSKAPVMSGGLAAFASSDMFKSPVCIPMLYYQTCKKSNHIAGLRQTEGEEVGPYVRLERCVE